MTEAASDKQRLANHRSRPLLRSALPRFVARLSLCRSLRARGSSLRRFVASSLVYPCVARFALAARRFVASSLSKKCHNVTRTKKVLFRTKPFDTRDS